MGFKRTPEGRVFFQGADAPQEQSAPQTANDETPRRPKASSRRPLSADQAQQASVSQTQIVTLLKTLNERLKLTQADRDQMMRELETHRGVIEDLEDKADRNERLALDLEHKMERQALSSDPADVFEEFEKTRALLLEKQTKLEKNQAQQGKLLSESVSKSATNFAALSSRLKSTENKQIEIDEKVDAASLQQAKLIRKVDKAIEDRARFMRKIERIEETVIQTRDSLNAKAMVLLTDQGVAGAEDISEETLNDPAMMEALRARQNDHQQTDIQSEQARKEETARMAARKPFSSPLFAAEKQNQSMRNAVLLAGVFGLGVVGFWVYSNYNAPRLGELETFNSEQFAELGAKDAGWEAVNIEPAAGTETPQQNLTPRVAPEAIEDLDWAIPQTQETEASNTQAQNNDDVGAIDLQNEQEVAALLESNPQELARQLNNIEPQRIPPAPEKTPQNLVVDTPAAETFVPAKSSRELNALINSDPNLPNVVKAIEDQAFSAIPEAQHDLAAIYTAGHGGVEQNYERAAFWFERAAENGIANASYNLGVLYHQGLGFKADIDKALDWYERAAAQGHPEAQYNLGIAYIEGIGVNYDPVKASGYFSDAANNGIMEAAYNLGLIYENGLLGDSKPDDALLWYKQAADQGSPEARAALEELARSLEIKIEDVNRLVESMKAANDIRSGKTPVSAPAKAATKSPEPEQRSAVEAPAAPATARQEAALSPSSSAALSSQALTAQVQEYLMRSGLYPGPADGITGPLTSDAVRSYQALNGLNADGAVTEGLLGHMLSNTGNAAL